MDKLPICAKRVQQVKHSCAKKSLPVICILLCLLFVSSARADRGSIAFSEGVDIFEPRQQAMIAWDGKEEILVLSTDMYASKPTSVLEVLPLPSRPEVAESDPEIFIKATKLINSKLSDERGVNGSKSPAKGGILEDLPAGEIASFDRIGAHDISVAHVLEPAEFTQWVKSYLIAQGVTGSLIPQVLTESIEEYIQEGFKWFVFDVVNLEAALKTNQAIQYRFKSNSLFYPLKISRTNKGTTQIQLLILTAELLNEFKGIPASQIDLAHQPLEITSKELSKLNDEMDDMFEHRENMKLRIWNIQGELSSFNKDLVAKSRKRR